jgi:hypothetical protein
MRSSIIFMGILLASAGCMAVPQEPVVTQATMAVSPDNPACRDYTVQAVVDGKPQSVTGQACQQADGSWRVTESVAGQPQQLVQVYPPPYPVYVYDPWFWGPPIGFSIGAIVFVDHGHGHRFHTFHHGRGFAFHGHHGDFTHGGFHSHGGFHHGT